MLIFVDSRAACLLFSCRFLCFLFFSFSGPCFGFVLSLAVRDCLLIISSGLEVYCWICVPHVLIPLFTRQQVAGLAAVVAVHNVLNMRKQQQCC